MIYFYRILVNKNTREISHCRVDDSPIPDFKIIEQTEEDENGVKNEVEFEEWNGIYNHKSKSPFNAQMLFDSLEDKQNDLDKEPEFLSDFKHMRENNIACEKNKKQRKGLGTLDKTVPINLNHVTDPEILKQLTTKIEPKK